MWAVVLTKIHGRAECSPTCSAQPCSRPEYDAADHCHVITIGEDRSEAIELDIVLDTSAPPVVVASMAATSKVQLLPNGGAGFENPLLALNGPEICQQQRKGNPESRTGSAHRGG